MHSAIHDHRDEILLLARKHGAKNLRLFGSAVRREERPDSDLDFLVDMEEGRAAFDESHVLQDAIIRNFEVIGEAVLSRAS